jgi:NAD(P)-dependent dehydrogenase (short-subunit alcohol dehydrogenase family)
MSSPDSEAGTEAGVRGQRVLVVGASSGAGKAIALRLGAAGAMVAVSGRRKELLEAVAAEIKTGGIPVFCDVRDQLSCEAAVAEAADKLGALDVLVYCTGVGLGGDLLNADADRWRIAVETNLVGAALVTRAAIPHLTATLGRALYLSSVTASETPPWPGLGLYVVTKAALNKLVEAWRVEHPAIQFTRVSMGPTEQDSDSNFSSGTELSSTMDNTTAWMARGYMIGAIMPSKFLADQIISVLSCPGRIDSLVIQPRD